MTSSNQEQPAPLPPELAALQAEAAAISPPPAADPAAPGAPAPAVVDYYTDAKGLTDIAAEGLAAIYPSTAAVLDLEKRARFAAALAPLMEKYGLSLGAIFGRWGAEINFAFVASSLALPLTAAIQADRAAAKLAKEQAERAARTTDPQPARPAGDPYANFPEQQ